jgi:hypothetical protein
VLYVLNVFEKKTGRGGPMSVAASDYRTRAGMSRASRPTTAGSRALSRFSSMGDSKENDDADNNKSLSGAAALLMANTSLTGYAAAPATELEEDDGEEYQEYYNFFCCPERDTVYGIKIDTIVRMFKICSAYPGLLLTTNFSINHRYNFFKHLWFLRLLNLAIYGVPIALGESIKSPVMSILRMGLIPQNINVRHYV